MKDQAKRVWWINWLHGVAVLIVGFSTQAEVIPYREQIEMLLESANEFDEQHWAFNISSKSAGETSIISHDPRREQAAQTKLLSVNGKAPSEDELARFKQGLEDTEEQEASLLEMVNLESLEVLEEIGGRVVMSFSPRLVEMGEKNNHKLSGTLVYNAVEQTLVSIAITNNEDISPAFSVSINTFNLRFDFIMQGKHQLIRRSNVEVLGTVAVFQSLDDRQEDTFSDFVYVGK